MSTPAAPVRTRSPLFGVLIGLTTLGVLLQGLWAGLFLRERGGYAQRWVAVHALGAQVLGTAALALLLVLEVVLGEAVGSSLAARAVHVPLALALMALAVWLPLRARRG